MWRRIAELIVAAICLVLLVFQMSRVSAPNTAQTITAVMLGVAAIALLWHALRGWVR